MFWRGWLGFWPGFGGLVWAGFRDGGLVSYLVGSWMERMFLKIGLNEVDIELK